MLPPEDQHPSAGAPSPVVGECSYRGEPPRRYHLQNNRHPGNEMESYQVELRRGDGVDIWGEMKEGSRVALVACVRVSGWVNKVQDAGMEFWSAEIGG